MPSQKFLDNFKNCPDVGLTGYKRLKAACEQADLPLFHGPAPSQTAANGECFVTVAQGTSGWDKDSYHSVRHLIMVLNIYCDASRDAQGNITKQDAYAKAQAIFTYLDTFLDRKTSYDWPEVISCYRPSEPQWLTLPDAPDSGMLHTKYEVAAIL